MITKYVICGLVSMVPIIELRGAIPMAYGFGLDSPWWALLLAYAVCVICNMIPVPFIYFFARKILEWGADKKIIGKFFTWILNKGHKAGAKLSGKSGAGAFIALMLFVGIPLPGTGAWTGTLAASMLDTGFKKSSLAVMCGVVLAGIIMAVLSFFFKDAFVALFL